MRIQLVMNVNHNGDPPPFFQRDVMASSPSPSSSPSPPYPSAARISDSVCFSQYSASLKCLEKFSPDKSKCQEHFNVYKECKEKERQARLERNKQKSLFY